MSIVGMFYSSCGHESGRNMGKSATQPTKQNTGTVSPGSTSRGGGGRASPPASTQRVLDGATIFSRYGSAVFMIYTYDAVYQHQGSGFFINDSGLAVSNYHVFEGTFVGAEKIKLQGSDEAYNVKEVIAKSEENDFILFRVEYPGQTNYIPIAPNKPSIGEKVYAIGSPMGLENTFSSGEVSQWRGDNLMQISVLIDHGSSGGALINEYGQVVGITSGTFADGSQANLNYAYSIDVVKPYLAE